MTNDQRAALDLAILNLKTHGDDQLLTAIKPLLEFYESYRAAGASEGQAETFDRWWMEGGHRLVAVAADKEGWCGAARVAYASASAEIAALRERIAGMEKDAERYRWLREGGPKQDDLIACVWGETLDRMIDAAIAKEGS